jgi:hypothetical protein
MQVAGRVEIAGAGALVLLIQDFEFGRGLVDGDAGT